MKKTKLLLFALASLLILGVVSFKIFRARQVMRYGKSYLFEISGRDPYDMFRGRYISFDMKLPGLSSGCKCGRYYLPITVDKLGIGRFLKVDESEPAAGDYLMVTQTTRYPVWSTPPFQRFYLNEELAPDADRMMLGASQILLRVKVYRGIGVIEDLLIDGVPLAERCRGKDQGE